MQLMGQMAQMPGQIMLNNGQMQGPQQQMMPGSKEAVLAALQMRGQLGQNLHQQDQQLQQQMQQQQQQQMQQGQQQPPQQSTEFIKAEEERKSPEVAELISFD